MSNRLERKFQELQKNKAKAFIAYITAGDPHLKVTAQLVERFEQAGVDVVELGIPFSDPLADGTTIQKASQRALKSGTTIDAIFSMVREVRKKSSVPLVFMTYYNPVYRYGEEQFIRKCAEVGIDGIVVPDLPPEEAGVLCRAAAKHHVSTIFFVSPTTSDARIKANTAAATGFVYYVAITGVTGTKAADTKDVLAHIRHAKRFTKKPICAGFGIRQPAQIKDICQAADGVIVGSAIVAQIEGAIERASGKPNHAAMVDAVTRYVASLVKAAHGGL